MSTTEILEHVLDPFVDCFTLEAARKIVALRADAETQERLDHSPTANDGTLTTEEQAEYEKYRAIFHVITLLQSKARMLLTGIGLLNGCSDTRIRAPPGKWPLRILRASAGRRAVLYISYRAHSCARQASRRRRPGEFVLACRECNAK